MRKRASQIPVLCQMNTAHILFPEGSILILPSHLRVGLPLDLFSSDFPAEIVYAFTSPVRTTWPTHLILLASIVLTVFGETYKFMKLLTVQLSSVSLYFILLGPRTLLSNLSETRSVGVLPLM